MNNNRGNIINNSNVNFNNFINNIESSENDSEQSPLLSNQMIISDVGQSIISEKGHEGLNENNKRKLENNNQSDAKKIHVDFLTQATQKLKQIEQEVLNEEKNGELLFSEYEKYANKFTSIKQSVVDQIKKDYLNHSFATRQLQGVEKLLLVLHQFPLNEHILSAEQELLEFTISICKNIIEDQNQSKKEIRQAQKIIDKINSTYLPFLLYNHASLYSKMASEKISESLLNKIEEEEIEELSSDESDPAIEETKISFNWRNIFDLLHTSINKFKEAKQTYDKIGSFDDSLLCNEPISIGYEKLADYHFDNAKELPDNKRIPFLTTAIKYYQRVKKLRTTNLRDIDLSILNAQHELASSYKEIGDKQNFSNAIKEIRYHLKNRLPPQELFKTKPELIFYDLDSLAEKYELKKDKAILDKAIARIEFYEKELSSVNSSGSLQIEAHGYLKHFSSVFGAKLKFSNSANEFSMCPFTDSQWQEKRKLQFLNGLEKLCSGLAKEYSIILRPYQITAIQKWLEYCKTNNSGYFSLPTGAGKTILMALAILASKMPTLFIVSATVLVDQTIEVLQNIAPGIQVSRFDGLAKQKFLGQVLVTTYDSLQLDNKRAQPHIDLKEFGLVLADECHRSLTLPCSKIINQAKKYAFVSGFTATDSYNCRRVKKAFKHASEVFGNKIYEVHALDLIESKQLPAVKNVFIYGREIKYGNILKQKNKKSDYTDEELAILLDQKGIANDACDIYFNEYDPHAKKACFGQSSLMFCFGIEHAEMVCEMLNNTNQLMINRGQNNCWKGDYPLAACVHSKISSVKRRKIVQLHKEGKIPILVGDKAFSVGYDNPKERLAFLLRPTRSIVYGKQRGGRMLRPDEGKEFATIFEWVYKGLEQVLFKSFLENKAWAGIDVPNAVPPQRHTVGYRIEWAPNTFETKQIPQNNINLAVQQAQVLTPAFVQMYYPNQFQNFAIPQNNHVNNGYQVYNPPLVHMPIQNVYNIYPNHQVNSNNNSHYQSSNHNSSSSNQFYLNQNHHASSSNANLNSNNNNNSNSNNPGPLNRSDNSNSFNQNNLEEEEIFILPPVKTGNEEEGFLFDFSNDNLTLSPLPLNLNLNDFEQTFLQNLADSPTQNNHGFQLKEEEDL